METVCQTFRFNSDGEASCFANLMFDRMVRDREVKVPLVLNTGIQRGDLLVIGGTRTLWDGNNKLIAIATLIHDGMAPILTITEVPEKVELHGRAPKPPKREMVGIKALLDVDSAGNWEIQGDSGDDDLSGARETLHDWARGGGRQVAFHQVYIAVRRPAPEDEPPLNAITVEEPTS